MADLEAWGECFDCGKECPWVRLNTCVCCNLPVCVRCSVHKKYWDRSGACRSVIVHNKCKYRSPIKDYFAPDPLPDMLDD